MELEIRLKQQLVHLLGWDQFLNFNARWDSSSDTLVNVTWIAPSGSSGLRVREVSKQWPVIQSGYQNSCPFLGRKFSMSSKIKV